MEYINLSIDENGNVRNLLRDYERKHSLIAIDENGNVGVWNNINPHYRPTEEELKSIKKETGKSSCQHCGNTSGIMDERGNCVSCGAVL